MMCSSHTVCHFEFLACTVNTCLVIHVLYQKEPTAGSYKKMQSAFWLDIQYVHANVSTWMVSRANCFLSRLLRSLNAFELFHRLLWHTQICWSSGVTELSQARQKHGEFWPRCWPLQEGLAQIAISSFLGWQDAAIAQLVESMSRWRKQVSVVKKAWLGLINVSDLWPLFESQCLQSYHSRHRI